MSLIQNALEKMRRNGVSASRPTDSVVTRDALTSPEQGDAPSSAGAPDSPVKRVPINWATLRTAGYVPDESESGRFADYYRQIKRPLIEKALAAESAPDARVILLTSAIPADGKTFTAVNLALSMARERDISVLLVDADLARSRISEIFGLRGDPGLVDALLDESRDVESLVVRTDIRGLDILPAGRQADNATELLASRRMAQVMARLTTRHPRRLVLLDSAPLLGSTEAGALVNLPGQIVLVVRTSKTPRQAVLDAVARLDERKLQGLILNDALTARGSGYYYGYSRYGSVENEAVESG